MVDTKVKLCGIELDNPIIPTSGTFGYGKEMAELYDLNILGSFSFKGTTVSPRFGNKTPRVAECAGCVLNSVGLQNPGIDAVIENELPRLFKTFHKPVIGNISGFSVEEYVTLASKLDSVKQVGWIEVNISCPNVHAGGKSLGSDPKAAFQVTSAVRKVTTKPIIVKLTPNVTDIAEIASSCEEAGADGISLINTVSGIRIDPKTRKPKIANITGGVSGSALLPISVRCVWQVYNAVKIPIVGMGGVSCTDDVIEMMLAGATAVGIGAANLINPFVCRDIIRELPEVMEKYGITSLSEIIGGAH